MVTLIYLNYYFLTLLIIEVLIRCNNVIILQIGQGHRHFHHEGSMMLEKEGMVPHHAQIA
jgi:hypothetical protein